MNLKHFHHDSILVSKKRDLGSSMNHFCLKLERFYPFSKATFCLGLPAGLSPGMFSLWCPLDLHGEDPFALGTGILIGILFCLSPLVVFCFPSCLKSN